MDSFKEMVEENSRLIIEAHGINNLYKYSNEEQRLRTIEINHEQLLSSISIILDKLTNPEPSKED